MKKLPLSLLSVLLVLGAVRLWAAEPADSLMPDPQDYTTESVTEHGVTLTVTCPKVILPGFGNYVLITVRNDSDTIISFMEYAPDNLGVRFGISLPDERHGWTTISLPN
jgi:heme/copper-type cytochrome/quinol oxidase subunit 1